jgi:hypothetical protein
MRGRFQHSLDSTSSPLHSPPVAAVQPAETRMSPYKHIQSPVITDTMKQRIAYPYPPIPIPPMPPIMYGLILYT